MTNKTTSGKGRETVRVERRRRSETPAGQRERAEAPRRDRPSTPQKPPTKPPTGGGGGGGGTGGGAGGGWLGSGGGGTGLPRPSVPFKLPTGGKSLWLIIGALVLLCICAIVFMTVIGPLLSGSQQEGLATQPPVEARPTEEPEGQAQPPETPAQQAEPFVVPAAGEEGSWLVMLYQDADDKILEQDIYLDLNEAERAGASERVHIVAQIDRFAGGYQGDGNWTSTKRFYVTPDSDLNRVRSQELADLGEANMADGATLVDFVTWAMATFPAEKYALILSDHGMGWPGGWSDPTSSGRPTSSVPLVSALGDQLYLNELDGALDEIRSRTGLGQFELVGLDACLMGHLEVLSALAPHARYAVVSQETEPALGWAYTSFLEALNQDPAMDGEELSRLIVDSYIEDDQRIVDDQARAEFLRQGSPLGGLFGALGGSSAEQVAQELGQSATLTAVDLAALPTLVDSVNELAFALQGANQQGVARTRNYAQSFTSIFGRDVPPSYLDIGNLVQILKREGAGGAVDQAADGVLAAIDQAVVAEKHGSKKPGATGVSLYFPNSQLYGSAAAGARSYTPIAERFAGVSLWDDFLAYHYTGREFGRETAELVIPDQAAPIAAPGSGRITVSPVRLSASTAAPGRPVLISADILGQNIGYVYLFVGFFDRQANSVLVADRDYLESADTRESDGVYYPVWPESGDFTMEFEWEPIVFAISDGTDDVVALFQPATYGRDFQEAVYTVEGIYTYADSGESRYARLYFSDGLLRQVYGFTGDNATGSPREIVPQPGDQFTVLDTWYDLNASGAVAEVSSQQGGTLTFGDQPFTWVEMDAAVGSYVVGFVVEDLDGQPVQSISPITVE